MSLLTIVVPTWNRADNLELLLRSLQGALVGLEADVEVLVSDNGSSDRTPDLIRQIQANWSALRAQRHEKNLGADGNFASCVRRIESRYFWIIGDDDLPKHGVVAKIVDLIRTESPALIYMQSEWVNPITSASQGSSVDSLRVEILGALDFARRVHVWCTFISGMVIDRSLLMRKLGEQPVQRFHGTSLIQLGWTLPLLEFGSRFAWVEQSCILATKDNTGGYPLITVFGVNYPRIVHELFGRGSTLGRALIDGAVTQYLPGLIWWSRTTAVVRHDAENPWLAMNEQLGDRFWYWAVLVPMGRFPLLLAQPFRLIWRASNLMRRVKARLSGARAQPLRASRPALR